MRGGLQGPGLLVRPPRRASSSGRRLCASARALGAQFGTGGGRAVRAGRAVFGLSEVDHERGVVGKPAVAVCGIVAIGLAKVVSAGCGKPAVALYELEAFGLAKVPCECAVLGRSTFPPPGRRPAILPLWDDSPPSGRGRALAHPPADESRKRGRQKVRERKSKAFNDLAWLRAVAPPVASEPESVKNKGKGGEASGSG